MGTPSVSTEPPPRGTRRLVPLAVSGIVAVATLLWWGWPTLSGADDQPPVVVVLDTALVDAAPWFDRALRERGRRAAVEVVAGAWCSGPEAVSGREATLRVVVADAEPGCDPWKAIEPSGTWRWIAPSGASIVGSNGGAPAWVERIDLSWSLGDGGTLRRACEWWDACEPDGQVTVRSEPGVLTVAGAVRIARAIAVLR